MMSITKPQVIEFFNEIRDLYNDGQVSKLKVKNQFVYNMIDFDDVFKYIPHSYLFSRLDSMFSLNEEYFYVSHDIIFSFNDLFEQTNLVYNKHSFLMSYKEKIEKDCI